MGRYFLKISYDGAAYAGWQTQSNALSVQQVVQEAMEKVLRQPVRLVGSSRTDAGVHAIGQVAQADFIPEESLEQCKYKINMALPEDVSLLDIRAVKPDFRCRFDAVSRSYQYVIHRRKMPLGRQYAHVWYGQLNLNAMQECCRDILQEIDFQAFSKVHTQVKHFDCRIVHARWTETEDGQLIFEIRANRFLRGMVRALVGTMLEVGKGKRSNDDFRAVLKGKNRRLAGENVPSKGLCLMEVEYPESVFL